MDVSLDTVLKVMHDNDWTFEDVLQKIQPPGPCTTSEPLQVELDDISNNRRKLKHALTKINDISNLFKTYEKQVAQSQNVLGQNLLQNELDKIKENETDGSNNAGHENELVKIYNTPIGENVLESELGRMCEIGNVLPQGECNQICKEETNDYATLQENDHICSKQVTTSNKQTPKPTCEKSSIECEIVMKPYEQCERCRILIHIHDAEICTKPADKHDKRTHHSEGIPTQSYKLDKICKVMLNRVECEEALNNYKQHVSRNTLFDDNSFQSSKCPDASSISSMSTKKDFSTTMDNSDHSDLHVIQCAETSSHLAHNTKPEDEQYSNIVKEEAITDYTSTQNENSDLKIFDEVYVKHEGAYDIMLTNWGDKECEQQITPVQVQEQEPNQVCEKREIDPEILLDEHSNAYNNTSTELCENQTSNSGRTKFDISLQSYKLDKVCKILKRQESEKTLNDSKQAELQKLCTDTKNSPSKDHGTTHSSLGIEKDIITATTNTITENLVNNQGVLEISVELLDPDIGVWHSDHADLIKANCSNDENKNCKFNNVNSDANEDAPKHDEFVPASTRLLQQLEFLHNIEEIHNENICNTALYSSVTCNSSTDSQLDPESQFRSEEMLAEVPEEIQETQSLNCVEAAEVCEVVNETTHQALQRHNRNTSSQEGPVTKVEAISPQTANTFSKHDIRLVVENKLKSPLKELMISYDNYETTKNDDSESGSIFISNKLDSYYSKDSNLQTNHNIAILNTLDVRFSPNLSMPQTSSFLDQKIKTQKILITNPEINGYVIYNDRIIKPVPQKITKPIIQEPKKYTKYNPKKHALLNTLEAPPKKIRKISSCETVTKNCKRYSDVIPCKPGATKKSRLTEVVAETKDFIVSSMMCDEQNHDVVECGGEYKSTECNQQGNLQSTPFDFIDTAYNHIDNDATKSFAKVEKKFSQNFPKIDSPIMPEDSNKKRRETKFPKWHMDYYVEPENKQHTPHNDNASTIYNMHTSQHKDSLKQCSVLLQRLEVSKYCMIHHVYNNCYFNCKDIVESKKPDINLTSAFCPPLDTVSHIIDLIKDDTCAQLNIKSSEIEAKKTENEKTYKQELVKSLILRTTIPIGHDKIKHILNDSMTPKKQIRLMPWNVLIKHYEIRSFQLWYSPNLPGWQLILTENNQRPSKNHYNVCHLDKNSMPVISNKIIQCILEKTFPTDMPPDEIYIIMGLYKRIWKICGVCQRKDFQETTDILENNTLRVEDVSSSITAEKRLHLFENQNEIVIPDTEAILDNIKQYKEIKSSLRRFRPKKLIGEELGQVLWASIPSVSLTCKWRVICMNTKFDYLCFSRSKEIIKYNDVLNSIKKACSKRKTTVLRGDLKGYCNRNFGLYCVHNYPDKIFVGPYSLNESHDLEGFNMVNNVIKCTNLFKDDPSEASNTASWFVQASSPCHDGDDAGLCNPLPGTIDLTSDTDEKPCLIIHENVTAEDVIQVKGDEQIKEHPNMNQISRLRKFVKQNEINNQTVKYDNALLKRLNTSPTNPKFIDINCSNKYIICDVVNIGYISAFEYKASTIDVICPMSKCIYSFANEKIALQSISRMLEERLILVPSHFKPKLRMVGRFENSGNMPLDATILDGYHILGAFGVINLKQTSIHTLGNMGITDTDIVCISSRLDDLALEKSLFHISEAEPSESLDNVAYRALMVILSLKKNDHRLTCKYHAIQERNNLLIKKYQTLYAQFPIDEQKKITEAFGKKSFNLKMHNSSL